jgi:hypothetical protein
MSLKIIHNHCPTCHTEIGLRLWAVNGEILRCPKCKELLVDNPKRILLGSLLFSAGFILIAGLQHLYGANIIRDLITIVISGFAYGMVRKLTITKKDLVIRNKQTNQISYIDHADWNEILENTNGKENIFEITESL